MTLLNTTITPVGAWPPLSHPLRAVLTATRELRDAKQFLRGGNVVRGVARHERAKGTLYDLLTALPAQVLQTADTRLRPLLDASGTFRVAFEAYRRSGAASPAARALNDAERALIEALDQIDALE